MNKQGNILNPEMKANHFTVPEGYFDNLTARVMANVVSAGQQSENANVVAIRPKNKAHWLQWTGAVAACFAAALVFINILHAPVDTTPDQLANTVSQPQETYDMQYEQDMLKYAMIDYTDVYCYLSGANE